MSSYDLPVILVSASDNTTATKVISELIDNEVEDDTYKEAGWRVWRLENKYYEACVQLQALPDAAPAAPLPARRADAHLIYLTENEGVSEAEARRACAGPLVRRAAVRLALHDAAAPAEALAAWASGARYELVTLREVGEVGELGEVGEVGAEGVARARGALHAHVWPGLRRRGAGGGGGGARSHTDDEESSDGGSSDEEDEESAVERAEAFAEALGVLGALSEQRAEHAEHAEHALRRDRAEQLVAAFCRALGHDLRPC